MLTNIKKHPCFHKESTKKHARIHLPLIKNCNIQCNYCYRKFNCPNENRPGVTSNIIKPENVYQTIKHAIEKCPEINIVGIAGPGEALCEPEIVYNSFKSVRKHFPDLQLCLSTNGLGLIDNIDLIKELKIDFITITINTVDVVIAKKIYQIDNVEGFLEKQMAGLRELTALKVITKINTVVIPELYNDTEMQAVIDVAKAVGKAGAYVQNIMAFSPVEGSLFANYREPSKEELELVRLECSKYINQVSHCKKCRADSIGFL